jgi:hypothetical protein
MGAEIDTVEPPRKHAGKSELRDRPPDFLDKHELAYHLGCHIGTINRWIRDGVIPGPHSRPGGKHPIWLRKHYEEFLRSGRWPREAFRHLRGR